MLTEDDKLSLTEHLEELRFRLIRCFIAVGVGFVIAYAFKERIFRILMRPLIRALGDDGNMIFTGLPEAFFTYLKTALLAGVMLASPVILYQFWMFVSPGLYKKERHVLLPVIFLSTLFFVGGALFGYFMVFPYGFQFFLGFANENLKAMPSMREYLSFASKLLIAFGIVFEMPLVLTAMSRLGIVTPQFLRENRKYAILIFFIGAAIITPPDVVTQLMMAFPLMALYEVSILSATLFRARSPLSDDEETGAASETPERAAEAEPEEMENDGSEVSEAADMPQDGAPEENQTKSSPDISGGDTAKDVPKNSEDEKSPASAD